MIDQLTLVYRGASVAEIFEVIQADFLSLRSKYSIDEAQLSKLMQQYGILQLATYQPGVEKLTDEWKKVVASRFANDRNARRYWSEVSRCFALYPIPSAGPGHLTGGSHLKQSSWLEQSFSAMVPNGADLASGMYQLFGGGKSVRLIDRYFLTKNYDDNAEVPRRLVASLDQDAELVIVAQPPEAAKKAVKGDMAPLSADDWRQPILSDPWCQKLLAGRRCKLRLHLLLNDADRWVHDRAVSVTLHGGGPRAFVMGCGPGGWDANRPVAISRLRIETFARWWYDASNRCAVQIDL